MAFSLNKVMLIGNLGQDAETRFTTNNQSVTTFSVATSHNYKGKDGNWISETTWHNIVAWSLSDYFKDALKKGKKVYVEGRLVKRDYNDKEGVKRYITEVVSDKIIPLDARDNMAGEAYNGYGRDNNAQQTGNNNMSAGYPPMGSPNESSQPLEENDDLPF